MKALLVIESIHFQRGLDPKIAMGTGDVERRQMLKDIENLKWKLKYQMDPREKNRTKNHIRTLIIATETTAEKKIRVAKEMLAHDKREASLEKAWKKRMDATLAKEKEKKKNLKTLTPRQVAINKIVDRLYHITMMRQQHFFDPVEHKKRIKKIRKEIDDLKAEYNLKSIDFRRQTKYDPNYE